MKLRLTVTLVLAALATATSAQAQKKFSGKQQCAKADPMHIVQVADRPDHALILGSQRCTWSGAELGGLQLTEEVGTFVSDAMGNGSRDDGYTVGTAANGDKYYVKFTGTSAMKGGMPTSARCNWAFTGGTGHLTGLTGKGTCKGTFNSDGTANFEMDGRYQLPRAKSAK